MHKIVHATIDYQPISTETLCICCARIVRRALCPLPERGGVFVPHLLLKNKQYSRTIYRRNLHIICGKGMWKLLTVGK